MGHGVSLGRRAAVLSGAGRGRALSRTVGRCRAHLWRAPRVAVRDSAAPVRAAAPAHRRGRRQPARAARCRQPRRPRLPRPARLASVLGAEGIPPVRQAFGCAPAADLALTRRRRWPRCHRARCGRPPVSARARGGTRLPLGRHALRSFGARPESAHLEHLPGTIGDDKGTRLCLGGRGRGVVQEWRARGGCTFRARSGPTAPRLHSPPNLCVRPAGTTNTSQSTRVRVVYGHPPGERGAWSATSPWPPVAR